MIWDKIKNFSENENWGESHRMNHTLLLLLDDFRDFIDSRIVISQGTQGVHSDDSQHYLGNAADIVCPDYTDGLFSLWMAAERFNFTGIGLYVDWKYQGRHTGGLHLDVRALNYQRDGTLQYKQARWMSYMEKKDDIDQRVYLELNECNLKRFGLLSGKVSKIR